MVSDIDQLRAHFTALFARFGEPAAELEFSPGQLGPIPGEWTRHAWAAPGRVILYIPRRLLYRHARSTRHRSLIGKLAEAGEAAAPLVRYRLAGLNGVYPAAVRDGIDAYRGLLGTGVLALPAS